MVSAIQKCESAISMYVYPPPEPPSHSPQHPIPLGCRSAPGWAPYIVQQIPTSSLFCIRSCIYFSATLSICPTLFFSRCVHQSLFYTCFSSAALQVGSILFFWIPYMCVNIYLFFSFWLISLSITGSRLIHLTRTDSNSFLFIVILDYMFATLHRVSFTASKHCMSFRVVMFNLHGLLSMDVYSVLIFGRVKTQMNVVQRHLGQWYRLGVGWWEGG